MANVAELIDQMRAADRPFSIEELLQLGFSRMNLSRMVSSGQLSRPVRGVYRVEHESEVPFEVFLACLATRVPSAVVFGITAAAFHGLTESNIAVHHVGIPLTIKYPNKYLLGDEIRFVKFSKPRDLQSGVDEVIMENTPVRITSRERTLIDIYRLSTYERKGIHLALGFDPELLHDVLGRYLNDKTNPPDELKLRRLAKEFKVWDDLQLIIESHKTALAKSRTF